MCGRVWKADGDSDRFDCDNGGGHGDGQFEHRHA